MYCTGSSLYSGEWYPYCHGYHHMYGYPEYYPFYGQWSYFPHEFMHERPHAHLSFIETIDPAVPKKEIILGQKIEGSPILEYMSAEGAAAPAISVKIVKDSAVTVWNDNAVSAGYHIKTDLPAVQPGSKIIIEVKETIARLRWWEKI